VSRIETITTNQWKGVSSAGVVWSYDAEGAAVSDDTATLAQPAVPVYTARGFIPYSVEVGQDYPGFAQEMAKLLDQGYVDLLAAQTMTGSGFVSADRCFQGYFVQRFERSDHHDYERQLWRSGRFQDVECASGAVPVARYLGYECCR
jgi:hypothetical protein